MDDFASTALLGLISTELSRRGLSTTRPRAFEGRTERSSKRDLLDEAPDALGTASIVAIGRGIDRVPDDPALAILSRAASPSDLFERWRRLERYFHGRHRTRALAETERSLRVEHRAVAGPPPSEGEDLVITGLLAALFERIGAKGLSLHVGGRRAIGPDGIETDLRRSDRTAVWDFAWSALVPTAPEPPAQAAPATVDEHVIRLIADDPGRGWRIGAVADVLHTSPRSLQRALAARDTSFRTLLRTARADVAARLLLERTHGLAAVGYASGYADQAHFSREFGTRFNLPPSEYVALLG